VTDLLGLERGTVALAERHDAWRRAYRAEAERLRGVVGSEVDGFEHVGSTAVPGVPAKPVVDLLALVPDRDAARALVPTLERHGYEHRPGDVDGRVFLARGPPAARTHYLAVCPADGAYHRRTTTFRDHLRATPGRAAAYATLKRRLAARFPDDRAAYTAAKGPFVERMLAEA
jgi:GrpB-like predicted nucleotidyltransferase (UPF0157 family)